MPEREIPLSEIEGMPGVAFRSYISRAINAQSKTLYDTARVIAGQVLPVGTLGNLFTASQGEEGSTVTVDGIIYKKDGSDTNLVNKRGKLDFGELFIFYGLEFHYVLPARLGTYDAKGRLTGAAPLAKAANTYSGATLLDAITHNVSMTFYRAAQAPQENGLACEWPSSIAFSGAYGGDTEEGFCQNASGRGGRLLDAVKVLQDEEEWFVRLDNANNLLMTAGQPFRVRMLGLSIQTKKR